MKLRIGTRGSMLALAQAELVQAALKGAHPALEIEIIPVKTIGDRKQGTKLAAQGDKKDWIYDLEIALLQGAIDLAVHCGKDVPIDIESGTELVSILPRENPFDAFIGRFDSTLGRRIHFDEIPQGGTIGTASLRRRAFLLSLRNDLHVVDHRGNVTTRLKKLDESAGLHGIILACAGLNRLNLTDLGYESFTSQQFLPAVNQGTIVAQIRNDSERLRDLLAPIVDFRTQATFLAERTCAIVLQGDCHSSIGIFAQMENSLLKLTGHIMTPDGKRGIVAEQEGAIGDAKKIGAAVGEELLQKGGAAILEESRNHGSHPV